MATRAKPLPSDVLAYLDGELTVARVQAAIAVDRTQALADLQALATEFAERLGAPVLYPHDLHAAPADEEERARLDALIRRAIPAPTKRNGT